MLKKLTIFLCLLSGLAFFSCDEEVDGDLVNAPSGARDVDVAGKTFVSLERTNGETVSYTDANGNETIAKVLTECEIVYVFNEDNTYTATINYYFTDVYDGALTYVATSSTGYNNYALSDALSDTVYANYMSASKSGTTTTSTYISPKRTFTGYAGQLQKTVVTTGTWSVFSHATDGFEDVRLTYCVMPEEQVSTTYSAEIVKDYITIYNDGTADGSANTHTGSVIRRFVAAYDATLTTTATSLQSGENYFEVSTVQASDGTTQYLFDSDYFVIQEAEEE